IQFELNADDAHVIARIGGDGGRRGDTGVGGRGRDGDRRRRDIGRGQRRERDVARGGDVARRVARADAEVIERAAGQTGQAHGVCRHKAGVQRTGAAVGGGRPVVDLRVARLVRRPRDRRAGRRDGGRGNRRQDGRRRVVGD